MLDFLKLLFLLIFFFDDINVYKIHSKGKRLKKYIAIKADPFVYFFRAKLRCSKTKKDRANCVTRGKKIEKKVKRCIDSESTFFLVRFPILAGVQQSN